MRPLSRPLGLFTAERRARRRMSFGFFAIAGLSHAGLARPPIIGGKAATRNPFYVCGDSLFPHSALEDSDISSVTICQRETCRSIGATADQLSMRRVDDRG